MKILISLLLSSLSLFSIAQNRVRTYFFRDPGWRIMMPSGFMPIDSAELDSMNQVGKDTMNDKLKGDTNYCRNLFIAEKGDSYGFSASIMPFKEQRAGDFQKRIQSSKDQMIKLLTHKYIYATVFFKSSSMTIDGELFNKMEFKITRLDSTVIHFVELSAIFRGYYFDIQYNYGDELTKQQIETALEASKFDR